MLVAGAGVLVRRNGLRVTLVEATRKKADFLRQVVEQLRLVDVQVVAERAETAASDFTHRDTYDWATARALGSLPVAWVLVTPGTLTSSVV